MRPVLRRARRNCRDTENADVSDSKTIQLPWQGMFALGATLIGVVWYFAPLNTSRPSERSGVSLTLTTEQDVDARLWQDPLATAYAHDQQVRSIDAAKDQVTAATERLLHSAEPFCDTIAKASENHLLVLPVIVSGGAYAEYGENRLRARRAVLEALGTNYFTPDDGEHIGYVRISLADLGNDAPITDRQPPTLNPQSEPREYSILPYEWCSEAFAYGTERRKVLLLWVREEELGNQPLTKLATILRFLNIPPGIVRIIGPRTSGKLRTIVEEVTTDGYEPPRLGGAVILSPTATASDALLLRGHEESDIGTVKALLGKKVPLLEFYRITTTDDNVCHELIVELGRRGVRLQLLNAPKSYEAGCNHVALISEWDTYYGRALPLSFVQQMAEIKLDAPMINYPKNIHAFHYLRGIDGMLPGTPGQDQSVAAEKKTAANRRPHETIEGLNQADYLRRLAARLQSIHLELLRKNEGGLKAVGVLGSDVYDKLLVLKALRPALPGALFFTNHLDARLGHSDEWDWARNLIVASPFGLRLRDQWMLPDGRTPAFDLQGKILPFRDAYQTATYAATLFAVNIKACELLKDRERQQSALAKKQSEDLPAEEPMPQLLGLPRLFEIGRSGPYELPDSMLRDKSSDLQPISDVGWWNGWRLALLTGIGFCLAGLIAWICLIIQARKGKRLQLNRRHSNLSKLERIVRAAIVRTPSWAIFIASTLGGWLMIFVIAHLQLPNGEPFVWLEGISLWPTETLRLITVIMAMWFFVKTNESLRENENTIYDTFGLRCDTAPWWRFAPFRYQEQRKRVRRSLSFGGWRVKSKGKIVARSLWKRYIYAGEVSVRLIRVVPLTLFYIGAGGFLIFLLLLDFPPVPGRGTASFRLDHVFLAFAVIASVGLTFYIADATTLNRRLIDYLVKRETKWPTEAYTNLRKRWKIRPAGQPDNSGPSASTSLEASAPKPADPIAGVPPDRLLDEYLDIDLIATRTEVVGNLIYYPFVLITLIIISRISLFDNWTWPAGLFIVIGGNGGYAAWSAWKLRRTAENARQTALKNLNAILISLTAYEKGTGPEAQTARETITMITNESRGAFAAISRHPLIGALLLPSGGAGLWALTQYLPGLFQ